MNIVSQVDTWRKIRSSLRDKTIGFVPTMGYLHAGHLQLCKQSLQENDMTVVSIFVNPTQFNQAADLTNYPRDLARDSQLLQDLGVDYLLTPDHREMYADQYEVQVSELQISQELEGQHRPGHFTGMLTVVLKLLNLVQANRAYFGEKDYQQMLLVKKMVAALFVPTDIIAVSTMRHTDSLAMSSRNARLSAEQRQKATYFASLLHDKTLSCEAITERLTALGFRIDYITDKWQRRLGAVWLDDIRLIDNIPLN